MRMPDKNPLVSVIMGVHGVRLPVHVLESAIQSVLNQTFSEFEFLICRKDLLSKYGKCLRIMQKMIPASNWWMDAAPFCWRKNSIAARRRPEAA